MRLADLAYAIGDMGEDTTNGKRSAVNWRYRFKTMEDMKDALVDTARSALTVLI
jgi:hypothetical protein